MSVSKRSKTGEFIVKWMVNGKEKSKSFGKGIQAEAAARAYNAEVTRPTPTRGGVQSPQFVELINAYMNHKKKFMSEVSFENTGYKLAGPILNTLGRSIRANALDQFTLDKYVNKRAKKVKFTTIHRELCDIRAILNWAVEKKLIRTNPMAGFRMPRRDDAQVLPVSQEEMERIIHCSAPHLQRAMLISYFCGLRPGAVELLSIRYGQVNWSAGSITIISALKGGIDRREVPLHSSLPLRSWFEEDGCPEDGYIITWNGKPVQSLKTAYNAAKRRAGVSDRKLPLYSLRHAFVTTLLHQGVDIHTIANISGHDVRTMLNHYAHSMNPVTVSSIGKLPEIKISTPSGCKIGAQGERKKVVKKK
jgi:integrase